jgi:hypothetical protein
MFNPIQKFIVALAMVGIVSGTYLFLAKTESKTFFGDFLHEAVLTKEQLKIEKELEYERELEKEFGDDDDF